MAPEMGLVKMDKSMKSLNQVPLATFADVDQSIISNGQKNFYLEDDISVPDMKSDEKTKSPKEEPSI